jgi:predicted RNA binding protein YcfA (HicA-like mRNA interferase family)
MTVREILKTLHNDGWKEVEARTKGSHIQLKHPN